MTKNGPVVVDSFLEGVLAEREVTMEAELGTLSDDGRFTLPGIAQYSICSSCDSKLLQFPNFASIKI